MAGSMFYWELKWAAQSGDVVRVAELLQCERALQGPSFSLDRYTYICGSPALVLAVKNNHVAIVEMLLDNNEHVDQAHSRRIPIPLLIAAERGYTEIVTMLLSRGARVDRRNHQGDTALTLATAGGHTQIVRELIEAGVPLINVDPYEHIPTALALAATIGRADLVAMLLAAETAGSELVGGSLTIGRVSALVNALCGGYVAIVDMLLAVVGEAVEGDRVARVAYCIRRQKTNRGGKFPVDWCKDAQGKPALIAAVENGLVDVVEMLLDAGADLEQCYLLNTPLRCAALRGHTEIVGLLLSRGACTGPMMYSTETPLMLASGAGHTRIVEMLLKKAAQSNRSIPFETWSSAFSRAAKHGHTQIVELLQAGGANIDTENLTLAVMGGHTAIVKKLLDQGADVNEMVRIALSPPSTPLIHASCRGFLDIVEMLLAAGANIHLINGNGRAALVAAAASGRSDIVERLLAAGAHATNPNALIMAAKIGHEHIVDLLLAAGAKPQALRNRRRSALFHAARHGHLEIVNKLLAAGATVGRRDGNGDPVLTVACGTGNVDVVEALINASALTQDVYQAVHNAIKGDHVEVLELLQSRGVDVFATHNRNQESSLVVASASGSLSVVRFLLAHLCGGTELEAAARVASGPHYMEIVRELLAHSADFSASAARGRYAAAMPQVA